MISDNQELIYRITLLIPISYCQLNFSIKWRDNIMQEQLNIPRYSNILSGNVTLSLTDCSGYWTLLHVLSAERASTTVDCRSCYMPSCTGSMWQIEFGTSSPSQSTGVSTTRRQSTWQPVLSLSRISLLVSDCAQHTVANCMYRAIDEQHLAVRRSLLLDQQSGICFQKSLEETENTFRLSLQTSFFRQY